MKTIFVTGDLVWDTHIARLPWVTKGYYQPHGQTQLKNHYGGAWYLRDVIESALKATGQTASVREPHRAKHEEIEENTGPGGIAKGFSVWEWFEDGKSGVWRIKEFLGCQSARWEGGGKEGAPLALCQNLGEQPSQPDMLVIDDLGLGFASHETAWPVCLADPSTGPRSIVAKACIPFDRPLWEQKLLTPAWAPRVTVIVAAATLRDAGARLGCGFSWDQTIEEVQAAFMVGGAGWPLRLCQRVVVTFGRSGAAVFSRHAQSPEGPALSETLEFERFVFDPAHLERTWSDATKGDSFGAASVMTAALVSRELQDVKPSSHIAVSLGLAASREQHRVGAGNDVAVFMLDGMEDACFASAAKEQPELKFRSAFNRDLLDAPVLVNPADLPEPSLLTDAVGVTTEFLTVAAQEIVRFGWKKALESVPRLECGKYFTVDREEIERLNTVRRLINDYMSSKADARPLSIAVFGQPGSGKSFAIKQLSEALFGKAKAVLEFNLTQFEDLDSLHEAFHEVRDKSVQGQLPLVFWDEFDATRGAVKLGWLKEFLAPMQDAKFMAKGKEHPFGKCIFIFAGGTSHTFDAFDRSADEKDQPFRDAKGPDFVSRLRGFVNIKGPNPTCEKGDEVHVVRRALLLRSLIERHHQGVIQPHTGELAIHPAVLAAFLTVKKYCHGARSMESIVSLCRLQEARHFGPSALPPLGLVQLHVTDDFSEIVGDQARVHFGAADIERLAAIMHENWVQQKTADGWSARDQPGRDPVAKTDSRLVPYAKLAEADKAPNRLPARLTLLRLSALGYQVRRSESCRGTPTLNLDQETDTLRLIARSEHRRWMREKLLTGRAFGATTNDALMLHTDLRKFELLPDAEQRLDHAIARAIQQFLEEQGLVLVKAPL